MPVLFYAKVFFLHPDDDVDGVLERFGTAQAPFLGLVTDHENDPVPDRFAERSDLVGIRKSERVPGIENADARSDRLEVIDRIAERAHFGRIDPPRIDIPYRANVAIHFFDLALTDRYGGFVKRRHAKKIGRLSNAAWPVDEDHRSGHGAALTKRGIPVRSD